MTVADDIVMLICEGACNPHISSLDAAVVQERRWIEKGCRTHEPLSSEMLVEALRALVYRAHADRGAHQWACETCGHERRWGS